MYYGNSFWMIGRLTKDAEARATSAGKMVYSFTLAWNPAKDKPAEFFDVHTWDPPLWVVEYLRKGVEVFVAGRLQQQRWQNKNNETRTRVCIEAHTVKQFAGKQDSVSQFAQQPIQAPVIQQPIQAPAMPYTPPVIQQPVQQEQYLNYDASLDDDGTPPF